MFESHRDVAVDYALHWVGTPYHWAGDDFSGFDCSGFIIEILRAVGIIHESEDLSADGLLARFLSRPQRALPGALAFWLSPSGKARPVDMLLTPRLTTGASGGGSRV